MSIYDQAREALKGSAPGPWRNLDGYISDANGDALNGLIELDGGIECGELVALAPELATAYIEKCDEHEALKKLLAVLTDKLKSHGEKDYFKGDTKCAYAQWATVASISAALKKDEK